MMMSAPRLVFLVFVAMVCLSSAPAEASGQLAFDGPPPYWVVRALFYEPWAKGVPLGAYPHRVERVWPEVASFDSEESYTLFLESSESRRFRAFFRNLSMAELGLFLLRYYGSYELRLKAGLYPSWCNDMQKIFREYDWIRYGLSEKENIPVELALWLPKLEDYDGNSPSCL